MKIAIRKNIHKMSQGMPNTVKYLVGLEIKTVRTVLKSCGIHMRQISALLIPRLDLLLIILMTWFCLHFCFQIECY